MVMVSPFTIMANLQSRCSVCEAFLTDWLSMPLSPNEPEILKWKTISRNAPEIARQLFRLYAKIPLPHRVYIEHMQERKVQDCFYTLGVKKLIKQRVDGEHLLRAIEAFSGREEIEILNTMLEDMCSVKKEIVREWIGHWVIQLWDALHNVHNEHRKLTSPSNVGAAHGMCIHRPKDGVVRMIPPSYRISSHSLLGISVRFPSVKEEEKLSEPYDPYGL